MSADLERLRRIDALFDQALDLDPKGREELLDRECESDDVRAAVEKLLQATESSRIQPGGALLGTFGDELLLKLEDSEARKPGTHVGPYRLLREIGTSGAAVVFLAQVDDEFGEEVVVKLFHAEAESAIADWIASQRGHAETSGARVDGELLPIAHPGIVRLRDAGHLEDGRIYVVMDHVEGTKIDEYCDSRTLDLDSRLRLFAEVCDALQHAHAHLVVHGDLELSSILVDEAGHPKVLEIGLVELLGSGSARILRARDRHAGVWPDIVRLGEILLALLTGRRLHDEDRDAGVPASSRVGEDDEVVYAALARARGLTPSRLEKKLRGDLDAIVTRAVTSDATGGYLSAGELARDVRRYLDGHTPDASGPTAMRRALGLLRRQLLPITLAAAGLLVVGFGLGTLAPRWFGEDDANRSEPRLEEFVESLFRGARDDEADAARPLLARWDRLLAARRAAAAELPEIPPVEAEVLSRQEALLARSFALVGRGADALRMQREAVTHARVEGVREEILPQRLVALARYQRAQGEPGALATAEEAMTLASELPGAPDVLWQARAALGMAMEAPAAAREELERSLPWLRDAEREEATFALAAALRKLGELDEAERVLQDAVANSSAAGAAMRALGVHYLEVERPADASRTLVDAIGVMEQEATSPREVAETLRILAQARSLEGRHEDALEASRRVLGIRRARFGDRHWRTLEAQSDFAQNLVGLGDLPQAESILRSVQQAMFADMTTPEPIRVRALRRLAGVQHLLGEYESAERAAALAAELQSELGGGPDQAVHRILLARAVLARGADESAEASLEGALEEPALTDDWRALALAGLGAAQRRRGAVEDAWATLEKARVHVESGGGAAPWVAAEVLAELAFLHVERSEDAKARTRMEESRALLRGSQSALSEQLDRLERRLR